MSKSIMVEVPDELFEDLKKRAGNDPAELNHLFLRALVRDEIIENLQGRPFFYYDGKEYHRVDFYVANDRFKALIK